jgi:hypothetical protein
MTDDQSQHHGCFVPTASEARPTWSAGAVASLGDRTSAPLMSSGRCHTTRAAGTSDPAAGKTSTTTVRGDSGSRWLIRLSAIACARSGYTARTRMSIFPSSTCRLSTSYGPVFSVLIDTMSVCAAPGALGTEHAAAKNADPIRRGVRCRMAWTDANTRPSTIVPGGPTSAASARPPSGCGHSCEMVSARQSCWRGDRGEPTTMESASW